MHDVFISYSSKDKIIADSMCHELEEGNERGRVRCWYAPRDIAPGESWEGAIVNAIKSSRIFILIFSEFSNASIQVHREITQAMNAGCIAIPFRIDGTEMDPKIAYNLAGSHWIDAISDSSKFDFLLNTVLDYLKNENLTQIILTPPAKTEYLVGDSLNLDGISVTAEYSNGETEDVTNRINIDTRNLNTPGIIEVTVKYYTAKKTFTVTVHPTNESDPPSPTEQAVDYDKKLSQLFFIWLIEAWFFFIPSGLIATCMWAFGKKHPTVMKIAKKICMAGATLGLGLLYVGITSPIRFSECFECSIFGWIIKYAVL